MKASHLPVLEAGSHLRREHDAAKVTQARVAERHAVKGKAIPRVERLRYRLLVAARRGREDATGPRVAHVPNARGARAREVGVPREGRTADCRWFAVRRR